MKHKATRAAILTIPLLAVLGAANSQAAELAAIDAGPLRVGVASAVTTFEEPGTLAGFGGRKGMAAGVHKDVTATCVVFDNGAARLAFLALDIIALRPAEHLDFLRAAAAEAGIPPQHIMVNSSHTHYAPTIGRKGSYTTLFKERSGALFQAAVDDLEPPRLFEMGAWRIGDLYVFGLSGEVFSQIGVRVKRELAGKRVWTNGYTGAGAVYIPDAVSHREGGGVVRGTPVTAEAEDAIVANAIRQAKLLEEGKTGNGPVVRP